MVLIASKYDEIWSEVLSRLEVEINDDMIFSSFFSESKLVNVLNSTATILVRKFAKNVIGNNPNYISLITDIFNEITQSNFNISVVDSFEEEKFSKNENEPFLSFNSNLSSTYTFENFVVGPSNQECQSAALAAAINPGKFYNPLFIFGKSGLGKTHLLHAVGNYIRLKNNQMKVYYTSSDNFIDEYFRCIRDKGMDALKEKFKNIDILLIDDIQFLANREKVSEYFFNIFNLFINSHKQIIMTSDRPPLELKGLEDRLVSRFVSGLSVMMKEPDYETALKILKKKVEVQNLNDGKIDDDVLAYIAQQFSSDVRQLEGALNKLLFTAINLGKKENIKLNDALDSFKMLGVNSDKKIVSIEKIKIVVSEYYNISTNELSSKIRTSKIILARHLAMYLARNMLDSSLSQIGSEFGGRDHTTVINAIEKVDKLCKENDDYLMAITELKKRLKD